MASELVNAVKELAAGEVKTCVQCGASYAVEANGEGHCAYHTGSYDSWKRRYSCCGQAEPCQRGKHRDQHHCEYPYERFFKRSAAILNYVDTRDIWCSIEEHDLDGGKTQKVSVGQLLRWKSKGQYIKDQNLLVIRVGASVWPGSPYFFHVFSESDLDEIGKKGDTTIFKSSEKSDEYSQATWIIKDQMVTGVLLEAKAKSNERSTIEKVAFSSFPLTKGEHEVVQRGGIVESKPASPYTLPQPSCNCENDVDLTAITQRKARTDFKTLDAITKKQLLTIESAEPLQCNADRYGKNTGFDRFLFNVSVTNASAQPIMMMKLSMEFKLLNQDDWQQLGDDDIDWDFTHRTNPLPFAAPATDRVSLSFVLKVPHIFGDNDAKAEKDHDGNWHRSYIARHTPIRFRATFSSTKGFASRVFEFVEPVDRFRIEKADERDSLFLFIDDANNIQRTSANVRELEDPYGYGKLLSIAGSEFKVLDARKLVHRALKDGVTEVRMPTFEKTRGSVERRVFALIDSECQVVYGIKVQLIDSNTGIAKQACAPVRFYGEEDATPKPIKLASENNPLPPMGSTTIFEFNDKDEGKDDLTDEDLQFDDDEDDDTDGGSSGKGGSVNLKRVEAKLDQLNANTERIATALEKLVDALSKR